MGYYARITIDGKIDALECDDLDAMYKAIDCETIQIVGSRLPGCTDLYIILDEEGKIRQKEINPFGTLFYNAKQNGAFVDVIVGDVLMGKLNDTYDDVVGFDTKDEALDLAFGISALLGVPFSER